LVSALDHMPFIMGDVRSTVLYFIAVNPERGRAAKRKKRSEHQAAALFSSSMVP
jgi:hypothetical protein